MHEPASFRVCLEIFPFLSVLLAPKKYPSVIRLHRRASVLMKDKGMAMATAKALAFMANCKMRFICKNELSTWGRMRNVCGKVPEIMMIDDYTRGLRSRSSQRIKYAVDVSGRG